MLGKVALISLSLPFMSLGLCWLALCLTSPEFIIHAFSAFGGHRDRDFFCCKQRTFCFVRKNSNIRDFQKLRIKRLNK